MRISDWSSDVCSSDLRLYRHGRLRPFPPGGNAVGGRDSPGIDQSANPDLAGPLIAGKVRTTTEGDYVRRRSIPSCVTLATSRPSRLKMRPRLKPRPPHVHGASVARAEARRVGKDGVRTWRCRWTQCREKKHTTRI